MRFVSSRLRLTLFRFRKLLKAAEASQPEAFSHQWQASSDNPLGKIVVVPPPANNSEFGFCLIILNMSLFTVPPTPDSPTTVRKTDVEPPPPPEETVPRRMKQRLRRLNGKFEDI